jgi:hypothetical protein
MSFSVPQLPKYIALDPILCVPVSLRKYVSLKFLMESSMPSIEWQRQKQRDTKICGVMNTTRSPQLEVAKFLLLVLLANCSHEVQIATLHLHRL